MDHHSSSIIRTTLARGCSGQGRRSLVYTGFCSFSILLPLPSLSLSLLPLPPRASLSLSPPSLPSTERARLVGKLRFARGHYHTVLIAHGLGVHGFSTERARLAEALRFARGHYH